MILYRFLDDLVKAFMNFLDRKDKEKPLETKITTKEYSIKKRKQHIKELLKDKKKVLFTELFEEKTLGHLIDDNGDEKVYEKQTDDPSNNGGGNRGFGSTDELPRHQNAGEHFAQPLIDWHD